MEFLIEKVEKLGLENFLDVFHSILCKKTESPNKVAEVLQFGSESIEKINGFADNFSKCEQLYKLIQKRAKARNFLEALEETGNGHILEFIEEADFSTASTLANPNPGQSPGIRFNIPEPIDSFCGREDFLRKLHDQLKPRDDSETEVTVLSQVKIVSGLGGIGKTQTARKYITKQRKFYNNFIWINAETEISMRNSFLKLAEEIKIPIKNSEGKSRESQEIVKEIYNKICVGGKSNLIVFDNAEDYQSCKNFFPFGLHPDLTKPVILATSRNQEWKSTHGKIRVLPLDKMTDAESLEFILKQLEIPESQIPEFKEESKEFIELIGGLPLALQQAVAYIKQEKTANELLGCPYKMSDYVQEFKSSAEKLKNLPPAPDSSRTVFITWDLAVEKMKDDPEAGIAQLVIHLMSFLYADKIPMDFLLPLLSFSVPISGQQQNISIQITKQAVLGGLALLEKFSMIKIVDNGNFVNIHRQVQFVLLQNLKNSNELPKMFNHLLEKCSRILREVKMAESGGIFLNIHQIVNNHLNLIPMTQSLLDFMVEFSVVLQRAGRHSETLELYQKTYNKLVEWLGEDHKDTLAAQHNMAVQLTGLGRCEEALTLFKEILKKQEAHPDFGPDHPETIQTKFSIVVVLEQLEKYQEALELHQQVLAQEAKVHGESHPETLTTQNNVAVLLLRLGHFAKALGLFQDLEKKQTESLGPDHPDLLSTKHNKATVLFKMGQFEEAAKISKEVHEEQKQLLGENHPDTIKTLEWIALILESQGESQQVLDIYKQIYQMTKEKLGEDHPETVEVKRAITKVEFKRMHKLGGVLFEASRYSESLDVFKKLYIKLVDTLGENHKETLGAQSKMAMNLVQLERHEEASAILKQVLEKQQKDPDLGHDHPETIVTRHNLTIVLQQQGKSKSEAESESESGSLELLQQVLAERTKILGENHPDTLRTLNDVAVAHLQLGNFSQALAFFQDLETKIIKIAGPHHREVLRTKYNKSAVLFKMGRFEEAAKIFKDVYEKRKETLGENHQDTISTLEWIGATVEQEGKLEEALQIYQKVYESRKADLGEEDPDTISTKYNMADVLRQQEKYQESLEMFQQVLKQRSKIHGENHPKALSILNTIAVLHSNLGDFPKALQAFEELEKKQNEILGPDHDNVLVTRQNKATVLKKAGDFEQAVKIFNEVHEKRKEILGENHLDTTETLEWIAKTLEQEGKFKEALDTHRKVYEIRKMHLGEDHSDTIRMKNDITNVESKIKSLSKGE